MMADWAEREAWQCWQHFIDHDSYEGFERIIAEALRQAHAKGRAEGIEAAAKIVEGHTPPNCQTLHKVILILK